MPAAQPDPREPLSRMLYAQQISDAEMRMLLRDSAAEAKAIVDHYGDGFAGRARQAQLDIARAQQQMWRKVGDHTKIAIGDGADAASDSVAHLSEMWATSLGVETTNMRYALLAQGRAGIDSLISRGAAGIPLSQQVYRTSVASGDRLDRMINALLLNGASAREIATRVKGFIDPSTPGGASYAAMRLGRTELNNAFHETSKSHYQESPFIEGVKWSLSSSHPKPDECDQYAHDVHFRGGEPGVFRPNDVPPKPHPQCFCYMVPTMVDDDEFIKQFKSGKYDNYIDRQLGCSRA